MRFETEKHMSLQFKKFILSNFTDTNVDIFEQFKGLFGIPDYLLVERDFDSISTIISFELKLKNWKRALKQAFKYRSFSNACFVVVDEAFLNPPMGNIDQFVHFNIGLASFNTENELKIYFNPRHSEPFSQFFLKKIHGVLETIVDTQSENQDKKLTDRLSSFTTGVITSNNGFQLAMGLRCFG